MTSLARTTIAFTPAALERMKHLGEKFDISYARLITCLMMLPDDEVKQAIDRNYDSLFTTAAERRAKEKALLDMVKGISPERLAELLAKGN